MRTLQQCQDELIARGVKDVKFCFAHDIQSRDPGEVKQDAAEFLGEYLDGKYTEMEFIGDSKES